MGGMEARDSHRGCASEQQAKRRPMQPRACLLLAAILMICLHFALPIAQIIPSPYRYLGVIAVLAGRGLMILAARALQRAGTTILPLAGASALVVNGPFAISRNPIYLGMVCVLVGIGVLAGSVTPFLVVPVFAYWIDRRFIRQEEAMLRETFGAQYEAYRARVRRWL